MTSDDIRTAVLDALADVAPEANPAAIDGAVELQRQLDIDSMDFQSFLAGVVERTSVDIPERDYEQVATLDGCINYIRAAAAGGHR